LAETSTEVLQTIQLQAETEGENLQQSTAMTKFSHDILDVPFSRSVLSKALIQQQDVQRIDDALTQVSGSIVKPIMVAAFGITFHLEVLVQTPILGHKSSEMA
jgi:outer membrane receptor for monomeric catechols